MTLKFNFYGLLGLKLHPAWKDNRLWHRHIFVFECVVFRFLWIQLLFYSNSYASKVTVPVQSKKKKKKIDAFEQKCASVTAQLIENSLVDCQWIGRQVVVWVSSLFCHLGENFNVEIFKTKNLDFFGGLRTLDFSVFRMYKLDYDFRVS